MASTTRTLPPDPRTVAEMIPVRQAEIRARNAKPRCHIKGHGIMQPRPLEGQTYEQMWCGVWYDCAAYVGRDRCTSSASYSSRELAAYHGEPYVVDATHHEMWNGREWEPVTEQQAAQFWADRITEMERQRAESVRTARAQIRKRRASSPR